MLRILPRDAFNDANLLKCIAKLTMLIEDGLCDWLTYEYDGQPFDIEQWESDGSTYVSNLDFCLKSNGDIVPHSRPMNSRENWPLLLLLNDEEHAVFDEEGNLQDLSHLA